MGFGQIRHLRKRASKRVFCLGIIPLTDVGLTPERLNASRLGRRLIVRRDLGQKPFIITLEE